MVAGVFVIDAGPLRCPSAAAQVVAADGSYAPTARSFDVRVNVAPRLRMQLRFAREGYGPGDVVTATLQALRATGGAAVGAPVSATVLLDGKQVYSGAGTAIDAAGQSTLTFTLPAKVAKQLENSLMPACVEPGLTPAPAPPFATHISHRCSAAWP